MLVELSEISRRARDENTYVGDQAARILRQQLAGLPPDAPPATRGELQFNLGQAELKLGREDEAIELLTRAYLVLNDLKGTIPDHIPTLVTFSLGLAHLRQGETQNCCRRSDPEACLLPIRGGGVHTRQEPSRQAMKYFLEVARSADVGSPTYLQAVWLLNIAAMTVGEHPDAVPAKYLIPVDSFDSDADFPRFPNVAAAVGLDTLSLLGGVVADDFDGDDYIDVLVSDWDPSGQLRLFVNDRRGSFVERTMEAGLRGIVGGGNLVQADYDNDGDVDVFVLRGGWFFGYGLHPNSLLRNDGGTFVDVTFDAGLDERLPTQTAAWADYDNDGDLDLAIGNEQVPGVKAPNSLWRNEGDGRFANVAALAGVQNGRFTKGLAWGDYDGDRFPDLYVSNYQADNRLYHNDGDGSFTDVAAKLGVTGPSGSFPTWFWDYDNDGRLDIFVSGYAGSTADLAASYLGLPFGATLDHVYRGVAGGFTSVGEQLGLRRPTLPMGCNFGDLDNDGFLDFYLGTGWPRFEELMPSVMYWNRGGERFADVTTAGGFGHLQKGHGVAFADFDNDGDQDVFEQMGGAYTADKAFDTLYENPGFGHRWLTVKLEGTTSNRSAIGARLHAVVVEGGEQRSIYKHVNSGGSFGANPLRQTLGLGAADRLERLEVYWPTSDTTQVFDDVAMDRQVRIVEGDDTLHEIEVETLQLGS